MFVPVPPADPQKSQIQPNEPPAPPSPDEPDDYGDDEEYPRAGRSRHRDAGELTNEQSQVIGGLVTYMRIFGGLMIVLGVLGVGVGLITLERGGFAWLIQGPVLCILGGLTLTAAGAFSQAVAARGGALWHLVNALRTLRAVYAFQVWLFFIGLVLVAVVVAFAAAQRPTF